MNKKEFIKFLQVLGCGTLMLLLIGLFLIGIVEYVHYEAIRFLKEVP